MNRRIVLLAGVAALIAILLIAGGFWAIALYGHRAPTGVTGLHGSASPSTTASPTPMDSFTPTATALPSPTPTAAETASGALTPSPPSAAGQSSGVLISTLVPAPPPRSNSAWAYDAKRKNFVLFGGVSRVITQTLTDTWTWDGTRWTRLSPTNSPSARGNAAIVYDEGRGVTVLFGGTTGFYGSLTDTWTWDGTNWTEMQPSASPPSVAGTTRMSYDAALGRVVLFTVGALPNQGRWVTETWTWDGKDWTHVVPRASPTFPQGSEFAMSYYPPSRSVVLVTAADSSPAAHLEMWAFDGTTWSRLDSPGDFPQPCQIFPQTSMVYDASHATVVLFMCRALPQALMGPYSYGAHDTWKWQGTAWSKSTPVAEAPFSDSVAYDAARGLIVLFGGTQVTSNVIWTWDGTNWTRVG